jgi:phosphomannomutase
MGLQSHLEQHTRHGRDRSAEIASHQRMETNRQHLIQADPDAARILTVDFTTVLGNDANSRALAGILADYAQAKRQQGRTDLYYQLFEGTDLQ